jgi:hypothetical protein
MPVTYEIDAARAVITMRAHGAVTSDEFQATREAIQADPGHDPGFKYLVDLRDVQRFAMSGDDVDMLANDRTSLYFEPGTPCAVVTDSDEAFGLSRMYQMMRGGGAEDLRIFTKMAEAEQWLGLQIRTETAPDDE